MRLMAESSRRAVGRFRWRLEVDYRMEKVSPNSSPEDSPKEYWKGSKEALASGERVVESKRRLGLEARVGIEPTHKAFAEPCLTTWLPRRLVRRGK